MIVIKSFYSDLTPNMCKLITIIGEAEDIKQSPRSRGNYTLKEQLERRFGSEKHRELTNYPSYNFCEQYKHLNKGQLEELRRKLIEILNSLMKWAGARPFKFRTRSKRSKRRTRRRRSRMRRSNLRRKRKSKRKSKYTYKRKRKSKRKSRLRKRK